MIYDWDKSDLATVAPYISAHYQPALERSRGKWGGMYGLGHEIQEASLGLTGNHTGGPTLRYDLYKQVGAPRAVQPGRLSARPQGDAGALSHQ